MEYQCSCSRRASSRIAIIDATPVPAPKRHNSRDEKELIDHGRCPRLEAHETTSEGSGFHLDQEARQEPLRLQVVD